MKTMASCAMAGLLAGSFALPGAWAQTFPVYEKTGTIEVEFDGKKATHYTTWNTIPNQPGREVHTARWRVMKPMLLGGVNIAPDDVMISISSRETIEPAAGQAALKMEFSLEPDTFVLKDKTPASVRFHPADGGGTGPYYALTDGAVSIESVEKAADGSLAITGSAEGTMTLQKSSDVVHNADDAVGFKARFVIDKVSGG